MNTINSRIDEPVDWSPVAVEVNLVGLLSMGADGRWVRDADLSRHARLALSFLVVERGRRIARDELADLLWDERVPPSWKAALRGVVGRVRAAFAAIGLTEVLVTGPGWHQLVLPADTVVDVETAAREVADALARLADGHLNAAVDAAMSALRVTAQPFLPGVHSMWVGQRQELLQGLRLRALDVVADAALTRGDWPAALDAAQQAVTLAPLRESAYRRLARAHHGAGDRGEALRVLAACRTVLAEDIGVDTSPETEALASLLRTGKAPTSSDLREPLAHRSTLPPDLTDRSTPLVARTAELAALREAWHRAITGVPHIALVAGEAGSGKTRLIAEFCSTVGRRTVLFGRAGEAGPLTPNPLVEALHPFLPADAAGRPAAVPDAVRATLIRLTAGKPLILVVDDAQSVEPGTFAALRYAVREPLPFLVIAAFRLGEPDSRRRLTSLINRLRRECPVVRVDLPGLPSADVAELIRHSMALAASSDVLDTIADATAGNPFFVRELVQVMLEQQVVVARSGALEWGESRRVAMPDSVRDAILVRYERLPLSTRRVLTAASVCGREFDLSTLEFMPDLATVDVLAALEDGVGSHLLVEREQQAARFAFVHGLVHEALYQQLSAARRQRLHLEVATFLEGPRGGAMATTPRLAYHLMRGGPAVAERATSAAARAGAEALRRHAYDEAASDYEAALSVAGSDPAVRCRLRLELAGARWRAGHVGAARVEYETAGREAEVAGRPDLATLAAFGAAGHGPTLGLCDDQIVALLTSVLDRTRTDDPYTPRLLARLAMELAGAGDARASGLCTRALDLAESSGERSTVAYVLNGYNWVSLNSPEGGGLDRANRIIVLADAAGDRQMALEGRVWRCTYLLRRGELVAADEEVSVLQQLVIELRQPFYSRLPLRLRACLALRQRDEEVAQRLAAEAYALERQVHPADAEVHALLHALALAQSTGDWHQVGTRLSDALATQPDAPHWRAGRAVQLASLDQIGPAARMLRRLLADDAAALRAGPLAAFTASLIAAACVADDRLRKRIDITQLRGPLLPWRGSHVVAGCGIASLGPVDTLLDRLESVDGPGR
jgi:DNA-binding SARP family transcriptional activator